MLQPHHYPAIGCTTFGGAITGDRIAVAVKTHCKQVFVNALLGQVVPHGKCALARQFPVVQAVALIIRVAVENDTTEAFIGIYVLQDGVEPGFGVGAQIAASGTKADDALGCLRRTDRQQAADALLKVQPRLLIAHTGNHHPDWIAPYLAATHDGWLQARGQSGEHAASLLIGRHHGIGTCAYHNLPDRLGGRSRAPGGRIVEDLGRAGAHRVVPGCQFELRMLSGTPHKARLTVSCD